MSPSRVLVTLFLAFILGIACASFNIPLFFILPLSAGALFLIQKIGIIQYRPGVVNATTLTLVSLAFIATAYLGAARFNASPEKPAPFAVPEFLVSIKTHFDNTLIAALPEPHASLLRSILFGKNKNLPKDLTTTFRDAGLSHIIAVSGYNITIVVAMILGLLSLFALSPRVRYAISLSIVLGFVLMVGAEASVVRAGIMATFLGLSTVVGRISKPFNILVIVAGIMLAINPRLLVFDLGFELTFLATAGLFFLTPIIETRMAKWLPRLWGLRGVLATSLGALIATTPIILHVFGRFSIVALITNILVVPVVPLVMLLGLITGIVGMVLPPLASFIGAFTWIILQYIIGVTEWFATLPYAAVNFPKMSLLFMLTIYAVMLIVVIKYHQKIHH